MKEELSEERKSEEKSQERESKSKIHIGRSNKLWEPLRQYIISAEIILAVLFYATTQNLRLQYIYGPTEPLQYVVIQHCIYHITSPFKVIVTLKL